MIITVKIQFCSLILLRKRKSEWERHVHLAEMGKKSAKLTLIDLERLIGQWNLNKQNQRLFNRSKWSFTQMHSIIENREREKKNFYLLCGYVYALDLDLGLGVCLLVCLYLILANALQSNQIETWLHVSFGVQYQHKCWSVWERGQEAATKNQTDSANNFINW